MITYAIVIDPSAGTSANHQPDYEDTVTMTNNIGSKSSNTIRAIESSQRRAWLLTIGTAFVGATSTYSTTGIESSTISTWAGVPMQTIIHVMMPQVENRDS